ncbi:MAG: diguanylate cyclase [Fuerstiella sp.]
MTSTIDNKASSVYSHLTPAVPTDTFAIIERLLTLSGRAREELLSSAQQTLIPRGVMGMLLRSMKVRDETLISHGRRIGSIAQGVAQLLGWEDSHRAELELAALLHDLGKIGVSNQILHKPGKLSSEEYDVVTYHHLAATSLLQALGVNERLVSLLNLVFENFDDCGNTTAADGAARELPLGPRILAVADAYDSLSSPKSYRRGMAHEEVMKILEEQSGSRYDGTVVGTLNRWYHENGHSLFGLADPFDQRNKPPAMSDEERDEMIVLSQILNTLYQFQSLYDGFLILDEDLNYCVWSSGLESITGRSAAHVMGTSWKASDIKLAPITQTRASNQGSEEELITQVLRNGQSMFCSRVCTTEDKREFSVDIHTMAIPSDQGKVKGIVQLFRRKGGARKQNREYFELKLAATRDALTGVANRGQLETQLRHLLDDYHNHEGARHLSAIFLDVDRFKRINDTHGHKAGDQVLVDLTRLLQHETYSGEIIARYGGEEFVVLCPDADLDAAVRKAERLRVAIEKSSIGGIHKLTVTTSFGVSTAHLGDTVQTLLERADACLYQAKETGRNRTCHEGQEVAAPEEVETIEASGSDAKVQVVSGIMRFSDDIELSTSLELTALKIEGFIEAADVKVLHQVQGQLKLVAGELGFFRRWGSGENSQAVEIEIDFETTRDADDGSGRAKTRRQVAVQMAAVGKVPSIEAFEVRCTKLMRLLKSYLQSI